MMAHALWITAPGLAELRHEALAPPQADQCRVRSIASGVSRGTERLVLHGRVPESQWPVMRAPLQQGDFPFPVKYGYAAVGVVEAGPDALLGRRVFCLHPHQDRFIAPAAMCIPLPDAVPDRRAVLGANMETALNILWDATPQAGERVLVIGAGVVGLLAAFLVAQIPGTDLMICDADPRRAEAAAALGLRFCTPDTAPRDCELIIHASGNPTGLRQALTRAVFEGRILEASWYGDKDVSLPLGEAFHARRLTIRSTQVGAVSPAMRSRRSHGERLALALSLLVDARLDALVGPTTAFTDLPLALPDLLDPPAGAPAPLCPVVTYI